MTVEAKNQITPFIGCGAVLAMVISWSVNHSIGWALLHSICSWFYVLYYAIWGSG